MNSTFKYKNKSYKITRYPTTENRSLQAWNAADEYLLQYLDTLNIVNPTIAIYNDRFGFLSCVLHAHRPISNFNYRSQLKAIQKNHDANQLELHPNSKAAFNIPLRKKVNIVLLKIPKSFDLFRFQLLHASHHLEEGGIILCGFMTKYFSPKMLEIANEFFEKIEQSKALKKARVMLLQKTKNVESFPIVHAIPYKELIFKQYFGVFSSKNIDYASQFFIEHLEVKKEDNRILDLACGNGILAKMIRLQSPNCEIHLVDDSYMAIDSAKLNLEDRERTFFYCNDCLEDYEDVFFDFIVSNPPFHFEYETNIEVSLRLFQEAKRCLKKDGRFQLVANRHLNYKTHLIKLFQTVRVIAENQKFIIYECQK